MSYSYGVATDRFDHALLDRVVSELPPPTAKGWCRFGGRHEAGKWANETDIGPAGAELVDAMTDVGTEWGAEMFGLGDLTLSLYGGGYHLIEPGGFLDRHVDFAQHPDGRWRRANLLIYLNRGWADSGGNLELSDDDGTVFAEIVPEFGTAVLMESSDRSWHGHPTKSARWRLSFAGYLYSESPGPYRGHDHTTVFNA